MNRFPSIGRQTVTQARYQFLAFTRSPVGMFFTLGLPTIMLVLFNTLFGDGMIESSAGSWPVRQFYTGGLAAFTAVSATYTNLVNVVPIRRDDGILKRWRSTPVSLGAYLGGWVSSAVVIAIVGVTVQLGIGVVFYDLAIDAGKLLAMVVTFVVGVGSFAMLGLAVAGLVPNSESAPAVANATILPLAFISDIFIALEQPPRWLDIVGNVFPLKPFVNAFQDTLNPTVSAPAFDWQRLAFVASWGLLGALLATRTFRWEPSASSGRRAGVSRRRSRRRSQDNA